MSDFYVRVEDWRVKAKAVSHGAFRFYLHLRSFCRNHDSVETSAARLASTYGRHVSQVHRLLSDLSEAGWVQTERNGGDLTILMDTPPGQGGRDGSAKKRDGSAKKRDGSAKHTHKEYHKTTRPQKDSFELEAQESRVVALLRVASKAWPLERDMAHRYLDGFARQLANASPLSEKQLAQLDRLEQEASPKPTRMRPVYSETPEAKAIERIKAQVLREREEGAA